MGVDVMWEDESGNVLETLGDDGKYVKKILKHAPAHCSHCLGYIDEYGDTTFNRNQVQRLLVELAEVPKDALDADTRRFVEKLVSLAEKCINSVHTYVKFVG